VSTARHRRATASEAADSWSDDRAWDAKLLADHRRSEHNQTASQREITGEVVRRAVESGAEAVALTGSTARNLRTEISDLDFHVVGSRFRTSDLPGDVDVYSGDADSFWEKLRGGDDFVQWTLRFGCILVDGGIFRAGLRAISTELIWPDAAKKFRRLPDMQRLAQRLVDMGDRDAAQDQLRATLTSLARGLLLDAGVFPLARQELPGQLRTIDRGGVADALAQTIHGEPSLSDMRATLSVLTEAQAGAWTDRVLPATRIAEIGAAPNRDGGQAIAPSPAA
jgi:hypothetical protein